MSTDSGREPMFTFVGTDADGNFVTDVEGRDDLELTFVIERLGISHPRVVSFMSAADPDDLAFLTGEALTIGVTGMTNAETAGQAHLLNEALGKVDEKMAAVETTAIERATEAGEALLEAALESLTKEDAPLHRLAQRLDPDRADGLLEQVKAALRKEAAAANRALREEVNKQLSTTVSIAMKSIHDEVVAIKSDLAAQAAKAAMYDKTSLKGTDYEDTVEASIGVVLRGTGDTVEYVGKSAGCDGSQKGDHLIRMGIDGREHRVVVEDKARSKTRPKMLAEAHAAMRNRDAEFCIWVTDALERVPGRQPLGPLDEDVIVVHLDAEEPDPTALAIAVAQARLIISQRALASSSTASDDEIDAVLTEAWHHLQQVHKTLAKFARLKGDLTQAGNHVEHAAELAAELKDEILEGIRAARECLARIVGDDEPGSDLAA